MLCQAAADDVGQLLLGDLEIDFVIELMFGVGAIHIAPVSYTHLDVYKRQMLRRLPVIVQIHVLVAVQIPKEYF